jgi:sterol desaturase/sphingolipid hydroxylase (fatty acid hydroxylase superfamily)
LPGKPYPVYQIPLEAGMSIGMMLISVELLIMLFHSALHTRRLCRALLHRIRHRRVAGRGGAAYRGRHLHQDCRHRRRLDEDRFQD